MRKKDPKGTKKTGFPALAVSLCFTVAVCWICADALFGQSIKNYLTGRAKKDDTQQVTVPELIGQRYTEGEIQAVDETLFRLSVTYVYSDEPARQVLEQDPLPGAIRKRTPAQDQIELHLTVSMGRPIHTVPELVGMTRREAEISLRENGLTPEVVTQEGELFSAAVGGCVLRTRPAAGTQLTAGETVTLYVSPDESIASAVCPALVGLDIATAWRLLIAAGLTPGEVYLVPAPSDAPDALPGIVISQELAAGAALPMGTEVGVTVRGIRPLR